MPKTQPKRMKVRSKRTDIAASTEESGNPGPNPNQDKILGTLRKHWALGKEIDQFCKSENDGEIGTIVDFAKQRNMPERTVRTYLTFFLLYPDEVLQTFESIRCNRTNLPLTSGHISFLLTVKAKVPGYGTDATSARHELALEAAERNYTPTQLNAAIKRACGRDPTKKGRPLAVPEADVAVQQAVDEAVGWAKRCRATLETLMSRTPLPKKECNRLRLLLVACREFCVAAEALIGAKKGDQQTTELTDKAQNKIAQVRPKLEASNSSA